MLLILAYLATLSYFWPPHTELFTRDNKWARINTYASIFIIFSSRIQSYAYRLYWIYSHNQANYGSQVKLTTIILENYLEIFILIQTLEIKKRQVNVKWLNESHELDCSIYIPIFNHYCSLYLETYETYKAYIKGQKMIQLNDIKDLWKFSNECYIWLSKLLKSSTWKRKK